MKYERSPYATHKCPSWEGTEKDQANGSGIDEREVRGGKLV